MLCSAKETGIWDSVLLEPFTEESFISNLHQRFKKDHIYTYIGNVLVSINPYKKLALYSADLAETYVKRGPFQLPPHIYAVAGSAYRWLCDKNEDQCIIVSGESGSGKTEAARIVLQFIMLVTSNATEIKLVKDRLIQANTLLEAFGNAKTMKNDNASRFGKIVDIEFDYKGDPVGGMLMHYCLEKSRVTNLAANNRNFHIFYQLVSGADIHLLKNLKLQRNVEHYNILMTADNQPTSAEDQDKTLFTYTKAALEVLGFTPKEILNIFSIIAIVLKLGNLNFVPFNNIDGTEGCAVYNDYELYEVCELLGVEHKKLHGCLTSRNLDGGILADLNHKQATKFRDILCKNLYSRLFTWLVNKINDVIKAKPFSRRKVLGILDFYGFENLNHNTFEQFLINYSNEKIHNFIVTTSLKNEQEEIIKEGLEWTKIDFFNNEIICQLFENESHGLLPIMDEPCIQCDTVYLNRLEQFCINHSHCLLTDTLSTPYCFQIHHYAGSVTYSVKGFVEKNRDLLPKEISRTMFSCAHPLMQVLFPEGNPKRCCKKKPLSIATQLQVALNALLKNLSNRQAHYIRCIKPNELKKPKLFEMPLVQRQVRYLCLIPTVQLWRSGYCYHMLFIHFVCRYKMLSSRTWPNWRGSAVEGSSIILQSLPIPSAEFSFGRNKIFIRSPRTVFELEDFRRLRLHELAILIQKTWRCYHCRVNFQKMKRSQKIIAAAWRSWKEFKFGMSYKGHKHLWCLYCMAREEYRQLKLKRQKEWAARIIQRHYIQWKRRQFLLNLPSKFPDNIYSPICREWPSCSPSFTETNSLLYKIFHRWRCYRYRLKFDQTSRNRMREKVTASFIFKDRKSSYPRSVSHPFVGDYVRLRQNIQWKKICIETNDQYVVFADIVSKIARSSGKFVPILLVVSTRSMLILDQRTLQIKYRVPATEIYRMSLSPFPDDVAVVHIKASTTECSESSCTTMETTGCLFQSDLSKKKGDFVFQTGHVVEVVTKLFLVVQNAVGKAPEINITTEFEANFGSQTVTFTFKCVGLPEVRVVRKGNRMEVLV